MHALAERLRQRRVNPSSEITRRNATGFGVTNVFAEFLSRAAPNIEPTAGEDFLTTAIAWTLGAGGGYFVWQLYDSPARVLASRRYVLA